MKYSVREETPTTHFEGWGFFFIPALAYYNKTSALQGAGTKSIALIDLYSVSQENRYSVKYMLLLKNPQFFPNHYETLSK